MPKNDDRKETCLFETREFLGPDRLDSFRAYLQETSYGDRQEANLYIDAGFLLSEEGVGHFCLTADHRNDPADLEEVVRAAETVVDGLSGLIEAIRQYQEQKVKESQG